MGDELLYLFKDLGAAFAAVLVVAILYRLLSRALKVSQEKGKLSEPMLRRLRSILRWTGILVVLLAVLQSLGILKSAWAALTGILALLAVGFFAVWSILSNTLCALVLILTRPFEVGDTIELLPDGVRGKVVNFSLLYTTLREDTDSVVRVPNNSFFQRAIRCQVGEHKIGLDEQLMQEQDAQ